MEVLKGKEQAARMLGLAMATLLMTGVSLGGCDEGGDDDDATEATPTAVPSTPTPEAGDDATPTPTPEPQATGPLLEDGYYLLAAMWVMDLTQAPDFPVTSPYSFLTSEAVMGIENDAIVDGVQVWVVYGSQEDYMNNTDNYCIMPEYFDGVRNDDSMTPKCVDCLSVWDMEFRPIEEETTCGEDLVAFWNGEDVMYDPWYDSWGFVPTPEGYPSDLSPSDIKYLESVGTAYVTYSPFYAVTEGAPWGPEYFVVPYCNVVDDPEICP